MLWGAGHDAEGHTPFGQFAEALDGWLADRPAAERARAGAEYPELASLLPSLGRVRPEAGRSPEEERDRLFRATAGLLGELVTERPVMLVLDDLHAADAGSFQLLSHLARRARKGGSGWRFLATVRLGRRRAQRPRGRAAAGRRVRPRPDRPQCRTAALAEELPHPAGARRVAWARRGGGRAAVEGPEGVRSAGRRP